MRTLLRMGAFVATLFGATAAALANPALVTTDLNLRTGPGTGYARITAMPDGAIVDVTGCVRGYNWCRVHWAGYDGWASSNYLAFRTGAYRGRPYSSYASTIGIPLIAGVVIGGIISSDDDDYRDRRYYHHRDWDRDHRHDWRDNDWRRDRRHDRRVEKREHRQERRAEKREHRQERRAEKRERRHDRRADKHERRHESRNEHRVKRQSSVRPGWCANGQRKHHGSC